MTVLNGQVLRVDVIGDFNTTDEIVNVYQFRTSFVASRTDDDVLDDLIVLLRAIYDALKAIFAALVVFRRIRVQNLTTGLLVGERDFSTPVAGGSGGEQGAIQSAALVSFKTNVPRVVMRKYIPVSEGNVDGTSRIVSAAITVLNTFGTALLNGLTNVSGFTYEFGYLSPKTGLFEQPLNRQVSSIVATQRRRRPGVGS